MGCSQNSSFCSKIRNLGAFFTILLISSSTRARFPQGVSSSKLIDNGTQVTSKNEYHGNMAKKNVVIGSRPPRCEWEKYCPNCGKCEAIQVPIGASPTSNDISNYKPMCWKCKCGDFTFNP